MTDTTTSVDHRVEAMELLTSALALTRVNDNNAAARCRETALVHAVLDVADAIRQALPPATVTFDHHRFAAALRGDTGNPRKEHTP